MAIASAGGSRGFAFGGPFGDFNGPYNGVGVQSAFAAYDNYNTPQPGPGPTQPAPSMTVVLVTGGCTGLQSMWTGANMGGMLVTAAFLDGSMETVPWMGAFFGMGSAVGTNWSVTETGDTDVQPWTVTNNRGVGMMELTFSGCPGNTVFDRTNPSPGTPGSGLGFDFTQVGGTFTGVVTATYLNPGTLNGAPPVGDIFTTLQLTFPGAGGMPSGQTLRFRADTDGCFTCSAGPPATAATSCPSFSGPSTGSDLLGATVTATFGDNTTEAVTWLDLGGGSGSATGTNWSLAVSGDTASATWTLTNSTGKTITDLVIDLSTSSADWDTTLGISKTAGTGTGLTFVVNGGTYLGSLVYEYTGLVGLGAAAPLGDVFTQLELTFTNVMNSGTTLTFQAATIICGAAAALLVAHWDCRTHCWSDPGFSVQCVNGDAPTRWDDLTGNGYNLLPLHIGGGGQVGHWQSPGTGTGLPDLQAGTDWRMILQGAFNFFTATGKVTYMIYFRSLAENMALMADGVPGTNGLAMGYGSGNLDTYTGSTTQIGELDGAFGTEDSGVTGRFIGVMTVTYDGATGNTNYYTTRQGTGMEPPVVVDHGTQFTHVGLDATTGFALGGSYNNADPNRVSSSISWTEAKVWSGVLTLAELTTESTNMLNTWGVT